jgi:glycosyltransferase involved in cell wall biosynthesis
VRIAIDATSMPPRPAGAAVYAIELVTALARLESPHTLQVFARSDVFARLRRPGFEPWRLHGARTRLQRMLWQQMTLPGLLGRHGADVLHSTHHDLPLRVPGRVRRVVTVHDVTFLLMPARYPPVRRWYMRAITTLACRVADAIIVPSRTVRRDVLDRLGVPESRVAVVYEAAGDRFRPASAGDVARTLRREGLAAHPYVLSVGSLEPGKNRARLIAAMHALRSRGSALRLVIVGQRAWGYERDFALVRRLGLEDRVRFLDYVPPGDLPALYTGAAVFAFPSLYEGFGLPLLEAMACGAPVVTSNVSATAEVAGDAALLVDPRDTEAIAAAIQRIADDGALAADLRARGFRRAAEFSWDRAARDTIAVYERVHLGIPVDAEPAPAGPA